MDTVGDGGSLLNDVERKQRYERMMRRGEVILLICAMEKKTQSQSMTSLIKWTTRSFESKVNHSLKLKIIVLSEHDILYTSIEQWPECDAFIAFHSRGFPLSKALHYDRMYKPLSLCDIPQQFKLLDRRKVYLLLDSHKIATLPRIIVERDSHGNTLLPFRQEGDTLFCGDEMLHKPFVEKPIDAEDHNIVLYFANGQGARKLFRKTKSSCSRYDPEVVNVRVDSSYIYERYAQCEPQIDIKVYAVAGRNIFIHAEARRSPTVHSNVLRTENGREARQLIQLTEQEKGIAELLVKTTGQFVCGFDLIRTNSESFVIDVNGWSFVKNYEPFFMHCGDNLAETLISSLGILGDT